MMGDGVGRWLVRAGYAVILTSIATAIVVSVSVWGDSSSLALVGCLVVAWAGSGLLAYGRKLRGELLPGAFRLSRGLLSLPFGLLLAYYGPAIEQLGAWWALLLPHETFDLLASIGVPHWPALMLTVVVAPVELIVTAFVSQLLIVSPLTALLGRGSPVVESVRDLVGGIEVEHSDPMPTAGFRESTVWAGESALPE
jgi:hypothetical protein